MTFWRFYLLYSMSVSFFFSFFKKGQKPINHSFPSVSLWCLSVVFVSVSTNRKLMSAQPLEKLGLNSYCWCQRCLMVETWSWVLTIVLQYRCCSILHPVEPELRRKGFLTCLCKSTKKKKKKDKSGKIIENKLCSINAWPFNNSLINVIFIKC